MIENDEASRASRSERQRAIDLLRTLRRLDTECVVRNSGITFDIYLLFYERRVLMLEGDDAVSVDQISSELRLSGPTVRLVLTRMKDASVVRVSRRIGKTSHYALTEHGAAVFERYVAAVQSFAEASPLPGELRAEDMPAAQVQPG
jgi:DNA-binding transcriptional ArsR family regulator